MATTVRPYSHPGFELHSPWPQQSGASAPAASSSVYHPSSSSAIPSTNGQVFIATGKKRKRLQRACVACHKAKRRCDGGLPCSNCDFSGRTCCYSDSQGKTVAPTQRTVKPSEAASHEPHQQHLYSTSQRRQGHDRQASTNGGSPSSNPSLSLSPSAPAHSELDVRRSSLRAEPSLECRRELLCIFFSNVEPLSSMLDEISFLRDLSSNEVSYVLLYAMYAVSAQHAYTAHFREQLNDSKFNRLVGETGDGSRYAQEARLLLQREDERTGLSMIDGQATVEVAQALCLLAFFEFSQGRYFRASAYIQLSSKHIASLRQQSPDMIVRSSLPSRDGDMAKKMQKRNFKRLACLVTAMDLSISMMNGQSMLTKPWDIFAIMDGAYKGSLRPVEEDADTISMEHLARISFLLNNALELLLKTANNAGSSSSSSLPLPSSMQDIDRQVAQCEEDLHRWADALPRTLHFNEGCLGHVRRVLNDHGHSSPSQLSKSGAVCWIMMHTMAETTTLCLTELASHHSADRTSKLAACKNLLILLDLSNPASLPPLFAALSISVLYSVSSSVRDRNGDDKEWARVYTAARSYAATQEQLRDCVWTSMAQWWRRCSSSSSSSGASPSPSSLRLPLPSPPASATDHHRRPSSTSPISLQPLKAPSSSSSHRQLQSSPRSSYHFLPPLNNLAPGSVPTLPPLRLGPPSSSEKAGRAFWDQSSAPKSMTVGRS